MTSGGDPLVRGERSSGRPWILGVDDHLASRISTSASLRLLGYVCEHVGNATEALVALDEFGPDVVLIEWNLRDGGGLGLAASMRSQSVQRGRSLCVIAMSTQAEPADFRQREEVADYILKPADIPDLERRMLDAWGRR